MSPLLAQMSLKMLSTVGPLIWSPSCMSMVLRTRRAIADWTTFVRSRQSIQLQHYQLCVKNLSAIRYTLSPESTLLLSNHISLQSPKITHRLQVERVNELDDVLPFHPVTFRMEIESDVFEIISFEAVDKLLVAVGHNCFFSILLRQVYDCLWIISYGNLTYCLK